MKKTIVLTCTLVVAVATRGISQGIDFQHGAWKDVVAKAKKENKYIFVDFYATWCGPCKQMSRDVFTDPTVAQFFNASFVNFKVDGDREEEALVRSIDLAAYPTLVVFDSRGRMMYKSVGALDVTELLNLGNMVQNFETNKTKVLLGSASKEQLINYLHVGRLADSVNYDRLARAAVKNFGDNDLITMETWWVFQSVIRNMNSPEFQKIIDDAERLYDVHHDYWDYVSEVMTLYFDSVAAKGNVEALKPYKVMMHKLYQNLSIEKEYEYFDLNTDAEYHLKRNELDQYGATISKWVEKYYKDDWKELSKQALKLSEKDVDTQYKQRAIEWAILARDQSENKTTIYYLTKVYQNAGEIELAIRTAESLLSLELDSDEVEFVKDYIEKLKG
jgi:thioredoxin-related protein